MSAKAIIPIVVVLFLVAIASSVFFVEWRDAVASTCPACGRDIHARWKFHLTTEDGKQKTFCCAKCGILEKLKQKGQVATATATDYATEKPVPVEEAVYVWNSNVEHCVVPQKRDWTDQRPMRLAWDRCIPSLIAFRTKEEASQFQSEHGGTLVSYSESLALIKAPPTDP